MRLSRILIAVAAAFSSSAFAVPPPGAQGFPQDDTTRAPQNPANPADAEAREENPWLTSPQNDAWHSSAQRESDDAQVPGRTASYGDAQREASESGRSSVPQPVPERWPSNGEQS